MSFPAHLQERASVGLPALLVEVYRNKPTGIVLQKRIDADGLLPEQMISYNRFA